MIYHSNLTAPDLQPHFHYVTCRVMGHSQGHDVLSDFTDKADNDPVFGVYRACGMLTHDEAGILFNVARAVGGTWLDIGGLTGWSACHMAAAGCKVYSVDPMYANSQFRGRAEENIAAAGFRDRVSLWACTSAEFFAKTRRSFDGILIDGEHSAPYPMQDAEAAMRRATLGGVVLFHDASMYQVRKAYHALGNSGWGTRLYRTPHGLALCHRNGFEPPEHVPDPRVA